MTARRNSSVFPAGRLRHNQPTQAHETAAVVRKTPRTDKRCPKIAKAAPWKLGIRAMYHGKIALSGAGCAMKNSNRRYVRVWSIPVIKIDVTPPSAAVERKPRIKRHLCQRKKIAANGRVS